MRSLRERGVLVEIYDPIVWSLYCRRLNEEVTRRFLASPVMRILMEAANEIPNQDRS